MTAAEAEAPKAMTHLTGCADNTPTISRRYHTRVQQMPQWSDSEHRNCGLRLVDRVGRRVSYTIATGRCRSMQLSQPKTTPPEAKMRRA